MLRRAYIGAHIGGRAVLLAALAAPWSLVLIHAGVLAGSGRKAAPQQQATAQEILPRRRVFPEIGPGVAALKRDSAGRYYVLAAPANTIAVYSPEQKRVGRIPGANSPGAKIVYAEDIDVDSAGRIYVADRGASAVKIFAPDGSLAASIPLPAPTSVAALSEDEFAVAAVRADRLVSIFDFHGKLVRSFGEPSDTSDSPQLNGLLNRGRVWSDAAGHIYFAFTYLPEPTFRKYDLYGYAAYEVSLSTPEFASAAEAERSEFVTLAKREAPAMKSVIGALGVDRATQEVWAAVRDELVHFDKDGNRLASYRTATNEGAPLVPNAILVEPDRIFLAADPVGIFEFARPDKPATGEKSAPPPATER